MYHVVFERIKDGVRTSSCFDDEADFKAWFSPEFQSLERPLAQGVTAEDAEMLCMRTPLKCYVQSVLDEVVEEEGVALPEDRDMATRMRLETIMAVYPRPFASELELTAWLVREQRKPGQTWVTEVINLRRLPLLVERLKRVVKCVTADGNVDNIRLFVALNTILQSR